MNKQRDFRFLREKADTQYQTDDSQASSAATINFKRALIIDPKSFNTYYTLATHLLKQEYYSRAERLFKKVTILAPNYPRAYHNWGICFAEQNKLEHAAKAFQKVLDLNPNDSAALGMIANVYHEQGLYKEALEAHEKVLAMNPTFPQAFSNYAETLFEVGDYEKAIEQYKIALQRYPRHLYLKSQMGLNLMILQRYEEAIDCFKALVDQNEAGAIEWMHWSMALWQQGKKAEAMEVFEKEKELINQVNEGKEIIGTYGPILASLERRALQVSDQDETSGVNKTIESIKWVLGLLRNKKDKL